jgi:Zn-dependent peptidase ImmA (M78 family)
MPKPPVPPPYPLQIFASICGAPDPESAMRIACRDLLQSCGYTKPPIPLGTICKKLGIKIVRSNTIGKATLRAATNNFEIWININPSYYRKFRFTIAHELAHVLLMIKLDNPDLIDALSSTEETYEVVERLCDLGASEILMPSDILEKMIFEFGITPIGLQTLYDSFLVPNRKLLYKIAEIIPSSAIILWKKYARHASENEELRIQTCYQRYSSNLNAPWLPKGSTVKHVIPDIVTKSYHDRKPYYSDELHLALGRKIHECIGISCILPESRLDIEQLPLFKGLPIPDESLSELDAVLLVGTKSMSQNVAIWEKIELHAIKYLSFPSTYEVSEWLEPLKTQEKEMQLELNLFGI